VRTGNAIETIAVITGAVFARIRSIKTGSVIAKPAFYSNSCSSTLGTKQGCVNTQRHVKSSDVRVPSSTSIPSLLKYRKRPNASKMGSKISGAGRVHTSLP
jgi:hypothetical protein